MLWDLKGDIYLIVIPFIANFASINDGSFYDIEMTLIKFDYQGQIFAFLCQFMFPPSVVYSEKAREIIKKKLVINRFNFWLVKETEEMFYILISLEFSVN